MASYVVPSGETSTGLNLTRDTLNVLNGGSAVDTHVNSGGGLYVSSGGEAYNTIVNSAGELDVYYEGSRFRRGLGFCCLGRVRI